MLYLVFFFIRYYYGMMASNTFINIKGEDETLELLLDKTLVVVVVNVYFDHHCDVFDHVLDA